MVFERVLECAGLNYRRGSILFGFAICHHSGTQAARESLENPEWISMWRRCWGILSGPYLGVFVCACACIFVTFQTSDVRQLCHDVYQPGSLECLSIVPGLCAAVHKILQPNTKLCRGSLPAAEYFCECESVQPQ